MLKLFFRKQYKNEEFLAFKSEESLISVPKPFTQQYFPPGKEGDIDMIFKFRRSVDTIDEKHHTKEEVRFNIKLESL